MSEKKQKELENRKNKIAPAPLLPKNNSSPKGPIITNGNNQNNVLNNKKDKKTKDKKSKETNNNNNNENKTTNNTIANGNNNQSPLRPPPGFQNSNASVKPPPGFQTNVTVNSVAKSPNNLTFTSSLGESYSILPAHSYAAPPDALARNQKLVGFFKDGLKNSWEGFRRISSLFITKCFAKALYLVHQQRLKYFIATNNANHCQLEVCSTCKQVLMQTDLDGHRKMHNLSQNFPKLNGSQKSTTSA
ncbi:hypothetical protein DOY81_014594 [Sarcophaga bullata]|nr:hypothetical protein DOY81_014594 [Sarcophaga bullata]